MFIMTRKSLKKFKFIVLCNYEYTYIGIFLLEFILYVKLSHWFVFVLNPQVVYLIYENIVNIIFFFDIFNLPSYLVLMYYLVLILMY